MEGGGVRARAGMDLSFEPASARGHGGAGDGGHHSSALNALYLQLQLVALQPGLREVTSASARVDRVGYQSPKRYPLTSVK